MSLSGRPTGKPHVRHVMYVCVCVCVCACECIIVVSLKEQTRFPTLPSVASRGVALADSEVEGLARNPGRYSLPYAGTGLYSARNVF